MKNTHPHIPILCKNIIEGLAIQPNDTILDATIGYGGHSEECLKRLSEKGVLFGFDRDPEAIKYCQKRLKVYTNLNLINTEFSKINNLFKDKVIPKFDKIIIDLGISSHQIDSASRGFCFNQPAPLDMRMNQQLNIPNAATILNTKNEQFLLEMFKNYAEIYNANKFIKNIILFRKKQTFKQNNQLLNIIKKSFYFKNNRNAYLKICAKVFQALRIEVNQELKELNSFLNAIPNVLNEEGRIAFLSFHSLEDKKIKYFFKQLTGYKMLHKHVIRASQDEIKLNSRSKAAKLRIYQFSTIKNVKRQKYPKHLQ